MIVTSALPWWRALNRQHWFVFIVASLAWFFDCLDSQFFNLARDAAMDDLLGDKIKATRYFAKLSTLVHGSTSDRSELRDARVQLVG